MSSYVSRACSNTVVILQQQHLVTNLIQPNMEVTSGKWNDTPTECGELDSGNASDSDA